MAGKNSDAKRPAKENPKWFTDFKKQWDDMRHAAGKGINTISEECCTCDYMTGIENSQGKIIYICVNTDSPAYLSEIGMCGGCSYENYDD